MSTEIKGGLKVDGMPVFGTFPTQGNTYYVRPRTGSDGNNGKDSAFAFATLAQAKAAMTADQNDTVFMFAESNTAGSTTDYQSSALDWSKDGCHIIGVGSGVMIGQRARIAQLSTVKTIEDLFTVSADNCLISNIEIFQGVASGTQTAGRAVVVSGQRNHVVNCQISGIGDTSFDDANARSLAVTGAENHLEHCYIGLDTVIRATATAEVTVGDVARTIFEDCFFNTYTSLSTFKMVTYSAPDRFVLFKGGLINAVQNITSAVAPTGALAAATSVNGSIILDNCPVYGFADVTTADDSKVLVYGSGNGTLVGLGLAGTVDVA